VQHLLREDADRGGGDIRGHDRLEIQRDPDHVNAILAGAQDKVDLMRRRVVAAECLRGFAGKPEFAAREGESVRSAQGTEIDRRQCLAGDEVDGRDRVESPKP